MNEGTALHQMLYDPSGSPIDYLILEVNPVFELILGIDQAQAVGRKASDVYGQMPPPHLDTYADVVRSGQPIAFETCYEPIHKTFNISVFSPGQGQFATIFTDITERKRIEAALRASEERFRKTFENANVGICVTSLDGRLMQVNEALCHMLGYSQDALEQLTFRDITHPDDQDISAELVRRVASGEIQQVNLDKRYVHKDGHTVWTNMGSALIRDSAAAARVLYYPHPGHHRTQTDGGYDPRSAR